MNKQHISDSGVSNKNDSYQSDVDLDLIDLKLPNCPECKKSFTYASSVKRHVHQCHPDNILLRKLYEGPKRSLNFRCDKCDRKFSEKKEFVVSYEKIHLTEPITKIMRTCPLDVFSGISKTHVGHDNDLTHLRLTADEKQILALKIASGTSFDDILKDIRNSTSDSRYKRLRLVSRKDLHNIKKSLMIDTFSLTISDEDNTTLKDSSLQNEPQSSTMEVTCIIDTANNSPLTDSYILNTSQSSADEVRYIIDTVDNTELTKQSLNNELQSL
ncbi:hypothetical protein CEXT_753921 [Caerostris extrusa]|uniref:C2H2-type domain-containing protein n=1 Tax=Caerostris extrusa TaxID=172846 RepID=A0AAV4MM00_CAEEX|nr:hypothetical protein CEXT_753921 [Caerostris extrusa]